ncbi:MAG: T9SS type A sorting domain-containing protein [Flavobacteriales bacterium]|jgi:hypothetical protein|nr:T9SS type A sorting domain-containing protein [Flavobacteriales bacterium]
MKTTIKMRLPQALILILTCFIGIGSFSAQTTIAIQSFEPSGDTWIPMTLSTPACTNSGDVWDYSTSIGSISPNHLTQFWGIADLNGNCGGTGFETITLPNVDVSLYTSVTFSFDYNVVGFDNGDDLKYELFYDNVSQGEVVVVNGTSNTSTGGWITESVNIPNTVTNVSVILSAKQNGASDYGGLDNVILEGTSTCTPATISSVSPTSGPEGTTVTITASSGDLTGGSVLFNGVAATITSSNATTIVCTVPTGATSGDLTITDGQPCTTTYSSFTVTCGPTTEPTSSSSGLNFTGVDCQNFTINWSSGDGTNRIVVVSTAAITGVPADQTAYTANATFGSGNTLNAGEYIVYNGTGSSVTVTGLTVNTSYFVSVYEYNGTTINCTENYLTSSILSGTQATLSACTTCPEIKSILVNSCGNSSDEGTDEYVVFKNGSSALNVDDIQIDFPSAGSYCNTACGGNTIGNNAAYISSLNAVAGCTKFAYADPIPAEATVMLFTGQTPSYVYDFSTMCGNGELVYALFCSNTSGSGRYGNSSGANRTTSMTWGSCNQSVTFFSSSANTGSDGDYVSFDASGTPAYNNEGACLAQPLSVEVIAFNARKQNRGVVVEWQTISEDLIDSYNIYKSSNGTDYKMINTIAVSDLRNENMTYTSTDPAEIKSITYYMLTVEKNGEEETIAYTSVSTDEKKFEIKTAEDCWVLHNQNNLEGTVALLNSSGQVLREYMLNDDEVYLSHTALPQGIYFVHVKSNNVSQVVKLIK